MLRLLVAAGGTGGGVYPALAVVGELVASSEDVTVLWIGGEGGMEASLVARAGLAFKAIPAAGLHGVGLRAFPGNALRMLRGVRASRAILEDFQPDVLFYTGGYVGVPMAFAARKRQQAMFVPDIEPALALRWISRWVRAVAVISEDARAFYPTEENVIVTGYPTRGMLKPVDRSAAREVLGLSPDLPTVLVFGGSRGARSINQALASCLSDLLGTMQVIHISGELDWPQVERRREALGPIEKERYRAFAYAHEEMNAIFSSADLVVSRAGAAVLGEYPLFGLPAILVPYPHAWRYQQVNARYLEQRDAALIIRDQDLEEKLAQTVVELISDTGKRQAMAAAMRALHTPGAANRIAALLRSLSTTGEALRG